METTYTDWNKECELLKDYLKFSSDVYADNLIRQHQTMRTFKDTGLLFFDSDTLMHKVVSCSFKEWKTFKDWVIFQ